MAVCDQRWKHIEAGRSSVAPGISGRFRVSTGDIRREVKMLTNHDLAHFDQIMVDKHGTWFSAHLVRLIRKADVVNREKLRQVFPAEVLAVELWDAGELPNSVEELEVLL